MMKKDVHCVQGVYEGSDICKTPAWGQHHYKLNITFPAGAKGLYVFASVFGYIHRMIEKAVFS